MSLYCVVHLSPRVPAKESRFTTLEVWNESTSPFRIVKSTRGGWAAVAGFEEAGAAPPARPTRGGVQVSLFVEMDHSPLGEPAQMHSAVSYDALTSKRTELRGEWRRRAPVRAPDCVFFINIPPTDVLFLLRVYERSPLRVDTNYCKLNQTADLAVLRSYVAEEASLPMFISADAYFAKFMSESHLERARCEVGWIQACDIHPPFKTDWLDVLKALHRRWIEPEVRAIVNLSMGKKWSKGIMSLHGGAPIDGQDTSAVPAWAGLVTTPMNQRVNGMLLLPQGGDGDDIFSLRSLGGLSAQSTWYHDSSKPAVTEAWLRARLEEVLDARGMTLASWASIVKSMISSPSMAGEWTPAQHECLASYIRIVRIHCTTRQYNYDHQYDWGPRKWFPTDTMKRSLTAIDDCDGSAASTYAIAMCVLFPGGGGWRDPHVQLLRQLGSLVGFPCGVVGTTGDAKHSSGHMYCAFIPCATFCRAVYSQGLDGPGGRAVCGQFTRTFGFRPVPWHTKTAVCENIFFTTPYYSSHEGVSPRKEGALGALRKWINAKEGGDFTDWTHYTTTHITGKGEDGQDYAIRVFTDVLHHLGVSAGEEEPRTLPGGGGATSGGGSGRYLSFVLFQPIAKSPDRDGERIGNSQGYGHPIEMMGADRPEFELHATLPSMPSALMQSEHKIIAAFEHPIVALPAEAEDCFADQAGWIRDMLQALPAKLRARGMLMKNAPSESNKRVTLFVYDLPCSDAFVGGIHDLYKNLSAAGVSVHKYGWSLAFVFHI